MSKRNNLFLVARIFFAVLLCVLALSMVISCGNDDEPDAGANSENKAGCNGNHVWDSGKTVLPATCTTNGSKLFTCTKCQETRTEITKGEHNYEAKTVNATCTLPGKVCKECTGCGDELILEVLPAGHNYVTETINATCTKDGAIVNTCSGCGDSYRTVTERATGHKTEGATWSSSEVHIEGCTYQHVEKAACTACGEDVIYTSDYIKHDFSVSITTPATCSEQGVKTKSCKNCDAEETELFSDVNAHAFDGGVVEANVTTYTCQHGCGETKTVFSAKEEISASVPEDALQSAGEVELLNASVKLDDKVLNQLKGADVTISAETLEDDLLNAVLDKMSDEDKSKLGNGAIFNFSLSQNNSLVSSFEGFITVTIPFTLEDGMDPDNIAVWYIDDDGKPASYPAVYCEINGQGYAKFDTNHFSYYTVIRMSLEERCSFYGHDFEESIVEASCGVQGYKMKACSRCKLIERTDFTPALSHDYAKDVTAPTCSSKGFTTYNCNNCGDMYISDYVDTTEHSLTESVVDPSCDSKGYTKTECTVCGYSYKSNEVPATGHKYSNGSCTVCGEKAPASGNTFLTMIDSIGKASSFLLESNGLSVVVSQKVGESENSSKQIIESLKATVIFDENGKLSGKGEAVIYVEQNMGEESMSGRQQAIVVFQDGMLYVYAKADAGLIDEEETKLIMAIDQDYILDEMFNMSSSDIAIDSSILEFARSIWGDILAKDNNPINKIIAKIVSFAFVQGETADGYSYVFNPTIATIMYNNLKTESVAVIFDKIFGAGAFDNTVAYLKSALGMTFAELEADGSGKIEKLGITLSEIFQVPEEMKEMLVFDYVVAMMEEMNNKEESQSPSNGGNNGNHENGYVDKIPSSGGNNGNYGNGYVDKIPSSEKAEGPSFTNETTGEMDSQKPEMTLEDLIAQIDQMAQGLKEATVFQMMGMEFEEGEDPYASMIDEIVKSLGKMSAQFTSTKDGKFVFASTTFNGFSYKMKVDGMEFNVSINGSISFKANETFSTDYSDIVNQAGSLSEALKPEKTVNLTDYAIIHSQGYTFIWVYNYYSFDTITYLGNSMLIGEEMHAGVLCQKYEGMVSNLYLVRNNYIEGQTDCVNWYQIRTELNGNHQPLDATVWYDEDGKVVDVQIKNADQITEEFFNNYRSKTFYFNPFTKQYSEKTSHNYKLVETIQPNGCKLGERVFQCSVCGGTKIETFGEGHIVSAKGTLNAGATSCEDGATITRYCTKCNQTLGTRVVSYHSTYDVIDVIETDTVCGKILVHTSTCACGKEQHFNWIESDHIFEHVSSTGDKNENDDIYESVQTYKCAVNNCGYSYTRTEVDTNLYYPDKEVTCYRNEKDIYSFGSGEKVITLNRTYEHHPTDSERIDGTDVYTCTQCNRVVYEWRYDSYGRNVYHFDYIANYGWERVYTGCNYVEYGLGNDSDREPHHGTSHQYSWYNDNQSCTQYKFVQHRCQICNEYTESRYEAPDSYYWDHDPHNWYYSDGMYKCYKCGTESALGADGLIVLEDMTNKGNGFNIGYFNKRQYRMDSEVSFELILNYQDNGDGTVIENSDEFMTITDTTPSFTYGFSRESGIISVNTNALMNYITSLDEDVTTVSLVAWVLQTSDVNFDEEGNPVSTWVAHALTFTLSEIKNAK